MKFSQDILDEFDTVTLDLDDGREMICDIISVFEACNQSYIALQPQDDEDETIFLYRFELDENGDPQLGMIETEDEYDIAADGFDEWIDTMEFQELLDEE